MFKAKLEVIVIQAESVTPIETGVIFWSHDKGTAKLMFQLKKDNINQSLSEGTIVPICLDFYSATAENGKGRHIYHAVIEDAINGIVSIKLEDNILGYQGRVNGSIYIELPDSRSLDTAGRFTFEIRRSPIDETIPELEDYYWQGFTEIIEQYHKTINDIKIESTKLLDDLSADIRNAEVKVSQLEQSVSTANTNLNARIDEISKKIEENDVYRKAETFNQQQDSVNVLDTITGTKSTLYSERLLMNGEQAIGSIFVKDLPGAENLLQGTSDQWEEFTFTDWQTKSIRNVKLSDVGLSVGDKVTFTQEIDNTNGKLAARCGLHLKNESLAYHSSTSGSRVETGQVGLSKVTFTIPDGVVYITPFKVAKINNTTQSTAKVRRHKLNKGEAETDYKWRPASEDYGVVRGQPNLLNGTSTELKKITTSAWFHIWKTFNIGEEFKVGDKVAATAYLKVPAEAVDAKLRIRATVNGIVQEHFGNHIPPSSEGYSTIEYTIPSGCTQFMFLIMTGTGASIVIETKEEKLIKGSLAAMGEWTPSQAQSGLTPVNGGMVPFSDDQYAALADPLGYMRAETNVVGRGAELQFDFKVIEHLANKYPYMFESKIMSERVQEYIKILKSMSMVVSYRGAGVPTSGTDKRYARMYIKPRHYSGFWGFSNAARSDNFLVQTINANQGNMYEVLPEGLYRFKAVSGINYQTDGGSISDGVTPAWLEVRDVRLIIELEVNGHTIIESIAAAHHRQNTATIQETTEGLSSDKHVTPEGVQAFFNNVNKVAEYKIIGKGQIPDANAAAWVDELEAVFKRRGDRVDFFCRINFNKSTGQYTPGYFQIPDGFKLSTEFNGFIWNVPLSMAKYIDASLYKGVAFAERQSSGGNYIRIGNNVTGNHWVSGTWYTDDPFPSLAGS